MSRSPGREAPHVPWHRGVEGPGEWREPTPGRQRASRGATAAFEEQGSGGHEPHEREPDETSRQGSGRSQAVRRVRNPEGGA
jgi:hypothetical protein